MKENLYVEALLDNSEGQLYGLGEEVFIRKTIDEEGRLIIKLNEKVISRNEFHNLMEIAGIRRENPTNFILQGKVKRIAQADEQALYELLTEIIGTKQFEDKKQESLDLVDSIGIDEKKALELLEEFKEKLTEIEIDKEDFVKYEDNLKAGNR